ncbi:class I SAM-dependent methyltransferase [Candidatus Saccharibacteria bacterium]|nr:class I SAM-dependent methyltransferase [Candidatus Saccharibacteria bacterium]MCP5303688.1 class I SAM-dependent methyltransferase [Pseudomonadales bacterium]
MLERSGSMKTTGNIFLEESFRQDESGVWVLKGHSSFGYSDGAETELYISKVISNAEDLSPNSKALHNHIIDWPSEYHLSHKRAQLLQGLNFCSSSKVLEIGCGCGAITRHLAEQYHSVVAIEGSLNRAKIAKSRVRDLDNVTIICAPFQDVLLSEKFDLIFCIGVLEYSASFFSGVDPYSHALSSIREKLAKDGALVLAIENRLGAKYFAGRPEDHVGYPYEGLHGYPLFGGKVQTFGRYELELMLKKYFPSLEWLYPFPDYKLPSCIVDHEFLTSGCANQMISEVVSERTFSPAMRNRISMRLMTLQLGKNRILQDLANSFLVIASCKASAPKAFPQRAILYSTSRRARFHVGTRVINSGDSFKAVKFAISKPRRGSDGKLQHRIAPSDWSDGFSLHTNMLTVSRRKDFENQFLIAGLESWCDYVRGFSLAGGFVSGELVDATWSNVFVQGGSCKVIDAEWVWGQPVKFEVLFIRASYLFLREANLLVPKGGLTKYRSGKSQIDRLGRILDIKISRQDFEDFIDLESDFSHLALGTRRYLTQFRLRCFLLRPRYLYMAESLPKYFRAPIARTNLAIKRWLRRILAMMRK